jgi:hypothetical protein
VFNCGLRATPKYAQRTDERITPTLEIKTKGGVAA